MQLATLLSPQRLTRLLPPKVRSQLDDYVQAALLLREIRDPRVLRALGPSGLRGIVLRRGKQGRPTEVRARHSAHFNWDYPADNPEMAALYRRAKQGQWDGDRDLPWGTDVDPLNPDVPLLPASFIGAGVHSIGSFDST